MSSSPVLAPPFSARVAPKQSHVRVITWVGWSQAWNKKKKLSQYHLLWICSHEAKQCRRLPAHIYLPLNGAYDGPAIEWNGNVKPFLFEMSLPQFFIAASRVLTRASEFKEGTTTELLKKSKCVLQNARQDHVKKTVIPILIKGPRQGAEYLWKKIF